eukprot:TRINITY_DN129_c0_g4_i1.p1 TRINITY_DN129_c0_g4~~TRINITY_DN129_c0_g4_i1.p1  ORF type:complete len:889 (+),score=321.78 TRINITY_DN129_c0_g4_i1:24-2669(+)
MAKRKSPQTPARANGSEKSGGGSSTPVSDVAVKASRKRKNSVKGGLNLMKGDGDDGDGDGGIKMHRGLVKTIDDDDIDGVVVDDTVMSSRGGDDEEEESDEDNGDDAEAKGKGEFDTAFEFDFEQEIEQPWDFSTARNALANQVGVDRQVTLDDKIRQRIAEKSEEKIAARRKRKRSERGGKDVDGDDDDDDDDDDSDSESESEGKSEDDDDDDDNDDDDDSDNDTQYNKSNPGEDGDDDGIEVTVDRSGGYEVDTSATPLSFDALHLSRPLQKAISRLGYNRPTPIQAKTIPAALMGTDVCGSAVTGSGKTAAFVLPTLERLLHRDKRVRVTRVLILTPTRELAAQCHSVVQKLGQFTDIQSCLIVGGLSIKAQESELRQRPDIVVATPGRMIDHLRNSLSIHTLDEIEILILDEADRMLDVGFKDEVEQLIRACPKGRQTLLFSATMSKEVENLIDLSLNNPLRIAVNQLYNLADKLNQELIRVRGKREKARPGMLLALCSKPMFRKKVIVFFKEKRMAHRFKIIFGLAGLNAAELHANLSQTQRLEALELFRDGSADVLLATDLASRGLDIIGIESVINYNMPRDLKRYIHRVGRTARAGKAGRAVSFVGEQDRKLLREIVKCDSRKPKTRMISQESIDRWERKIKGMSEDIALILEQEGEEKEIRVAEMEANRAQNILIHEREIFGRPARTWFQTEEEKRSVREQSRIEAAGGDLPARKKQRLGKKQRDAIARGEDPDKKKKKSRLTRKQRRNRDFDAELEKEGVEIPTERDVMRTVKSVKADARQKEVAREGRPEPRKKADKKKGAKGKKGEKKPDDTHDERVRNAFEQEMSKAKMNKMPHKGGGIGGSGDRDKGGEKRKEPGKKKFKSLAKHKRR